MKARTGRNMTGRTGKAEHNGKTEKDRQSARFLLIKYLFI
jgi:hypothetical protein